MKGCAFLIQVHHAPTGLLQLMLYPYAVAKHKSVMAIFEFAVSQNSVTIIEASKQIVHIVQENVKRFSKYMKAYKFLKLQHMF